MTFSVPTLTFDERRFTTIGDIASDGWLVESRSDTTMDLYDFPSAGSVGGSDATESEAGGPGVALDAAKAYGTVGSARRTRMTATSILLANSP